MLAVFSLPAGDLMLESMCERSQQGRAAGVFCAAANFASRRAARMARERIQSHCPRSLIAVKV